MIRIVRLWIFCAGRATGFLDGPVRGVTERERERLQWRLWHEKLSVEMRKVCSGAGLKRRLVWSMLSLRYLLDIQVEMAGRQLDLWFELEIGLGLRKKKLRILDKQSLKLEDWMRFPRTVSVDREEMRTGLNPGPPTLRGQGEEERQQRVQNSQRGRRKTSRSWRGAKWGRHIEEEVIRCVKCFHYMRRENWPFSALWEPAWQNPVTRMGAIAITIPDHSMNLWLSD